MVASASPTVTLDLVSVIIPTWNGALRIENCLRALTIQTTLHPVEVLVIDDGSTDNTAQVVSKYSNVYLIRQPNAGPAAARNRGAQEAKGSILLFTDDDCVPVPSWIDAMLSPFAKADVVGVKGTYRTHQTELIARFVQLEYQDKYRVMSSQSNIDFIDTYSAGYRRDRFLEMQGYDLSFPVACAEDVELSYRMSSLGWKMKFAPSAVVYHTHPNSLAPYLKKKYKFAYWRVVAVRKNPGKGIKDSHTPQLMKLQILFTPVLLASLCIDLLIHPAISAVLATTGTFLLSTIPFLLRTIRNDRAVALISPLLLAARSCSQFGGLVAGANYCRHASIRHVTNLSS